MTHNHDLRSTPARRGWSLIELLIVCTATGVLTVAGVVTIGTLMSAEGRGAESLVHQTTLARLASQFRNDTHGTRELTVNDVDGTAQNQLVLRHADGSTITYRAAETGVLRLVAGGPGDVGREEFVLPESRAHFETVNEGRIVRLVTRTRRQTLNEISAGELPSGSAHEVAIEAAVGWDLRHSNASGE